jgi:hypothetical protein
MVHLPRELLSHGMSVLIHPGARLSFVVRDIHIGDMLGLGIAINPASALSSKDNYFARSE